MRVKLICAAVFAMLSGPALACGPDSDCSVGLRHYRVALPETYDGSTAVPALLFAHGYRGSAVGVMRNGSLRRLASDLGAALIAVDSEGVGWNLPNGPRTPDSDGSAEYDYFDAVLDDVTKRFSIDQSRIVATGFSAGGMMVWNLACARPERYAGFVPVAGTFWKEPPLTCNAPVASIIHIHGDQDRTVPLLGRAIGPTRQGEVPAALEMYGDFGGFGPAHTVGYGGLECSERTNSSGSQLSFCLFSGGHSFRTEHLRHAWEQFEKAGQL